jgi:hypothetical protein
MDISGSGTKTGGIFVGIDLGEVRRGMEAREKLKQRALKAHAEGRVPREDPNFQAHRLVNTSKDKGNLLDMVV